MAEERLDWETKRKPTVSTVSSCAMTAACDQSIISEKGSSQSSERITGIQPRRSDSRKRNDPRRRPRGVRQKVEFDIVVS